MTATLKPNKEENTMAKNVKKASAKAQTVAAENVDARQAWIGKAQAAFADAVEQHTLKAQQLLVMDISHLNPTDRKKHADAIRNAQGRAARAEKFKAMLDDARIADVWFAYNLLAEYVIGMQIYAQDKVMSMLRALGTNVPLSRVSDNHMTILLVKALQARGKLTVTAAPAAMHDLNNSKSLGTYSAQATTSRQVLEMFGLLSYDVITKEYSLNEKAEELLDLIAA